MEQRITGSSPRRPTGPETLDETRGERPRVVEVWNGILHEFRNHLKVLSATATELRTEMPPSIALHLTDAVSETERNVQCLGTLLSLADASLRESEPGGPEARGAEARAGEVIVSGLDQVLDRAIRLAAPAVGRSVSIVVLRGPGIGVKNRGSALECLLAALLIDLARAADGRNVDAALRAPRISLRTEAGRGGLVVEIESNGLPPVAGSWRTVLAGDLAARLDATVSALPGSAGFLVQLR
jgi:hypothetical protein